MKIGLKRLSAFVIVLLTIAMTIYGAFFGDFLKAPLGKTLTGLEITDWTDVVGPQREVVIVVYWKIDCPNCVAMMSDLEYLEISIRQQGLPMSVVGVNLVDDPSRIQTFITQYAISFPVLYDGRPPFSGNIGLPFTEVFMKLGTPNWAKVEQLQWYGHIQDHMEGLIFDSIISYISLMEG